MKDEYGNAYEPESELSKLATLAFIMLTVGAIQLAIFHLGTWLLGIPGAVLAVVAMVTFWIWLFDYNPGIDYYRKRYGLRPGTLHQPSKEATPCDSNVLPS